MSVDCFLDTNVLVYAVSSAETDAAKRARALDLVRQSDFGLSAQVLQEFYVTVTRKIRKPLAPEVAVALMDEYRVFPTVPTDYPLIVSAVELSLRYGLSYWDGAILAAAEVLEAEVLYTEDLSHGQRYGGVRAVNPFLGA
jgi:predicted nucleic acid-binding protein